MARTVCVVVLPLSSYTPLTCLACCRAVGVVLAPRWYERHVVPNEMVSRSTTHRYRSRGFALDRSARRRSDISVDGEATRFREEQHEDRIQVDRGSLPAAGDGQPGRARRGGGFRLRRDQ